MLIVLLKLFALSWVYSPINLVFIRDGKPFHRAKPANAIRHHKRYFYLDHWTSKLVISNIYLIQKSENILWFGFKMNRLFFLEDLNISFVLLNAVQLMVRFSVLGWKLWLPGPVCSVLCCNSQKWICLWRNNLSDAFSLKLLKSMNKVWKWQICINIQSQVSSENNMARTL